MTLFGYGKTTKAIAKKFGKCTIFDDKFYEKSSDEFGNTLLPSSMFNPKKSDLEIPSPGIPPSNPLAKKAKNLISEYDLILSSPLTTHHSPFTTHHSPLTTHHSPLTTHHSPLTVWISGTNGKTTTTQMMQHLLKKRGSQSGGNIGIPLSQMDKNAHIWILESSSFTLHYTKKASPSIYILLPVSEDHISWHGSFKEYEKAKLSPLERMAESEIAIIPKKYSSYPTNARKITYENSSDLASFFGIDMDKIKFKDPFLMDALMALAVNKIIFDKIDYDLINSFEIDKHKLEEFKDKNGRTWVNDSKATNADATIQALKRYENKKIFLILGGDDKGADMKPLFDEMKNLDINIFAIGSNAKKLKNLSDKYSIECEVSNKLKNAVSMVAENTAFDTCAIALLSPAAASLDQFSSYAKRGKIFKEAAIKVGDLS